MGGFQSPRIWDYIAANAKDEIEAGGWYNSLGKYQIQGRRKEQLYTKDKTALNVILSDCTRLRTFSQYVYGGSIFHS